MPAFPSFLVLYYYGVRDGFLSFGKSGAFMYIFSSLPSVVETNLNISSINGFRIKSFQLVNIIAQLTFKDPRESPKISDLPRIDIQS